MGWARAFAVSLALTAGAQVASAQEHLGFPVGETQSQVLVIEFERAFASSAFGQRVSRELQEQRAAIGAESQRISEELTQEEQRLTDLRDSVSAEDFRRMAKEFDLRVQELRNGQDEKARALNAFNDSAQQVFFAAALPVLNEILQERGATLLLDRRQVFLSLDSVDITGLAVERINAAIGDGADLQNP